MFKILCCILFPFSLMMSGMAQEIEVLQLEIDSLKQVKSKLDAQSKRVGSQISKLTSRKLELERDAKMAKGVPIYCRLETKVYAGRGTWKDLVGTIPKGTTIMAYDFKNNYYFVSFDTLNGYVLGMNVETLDVRNKKLEKQRQEKLKNQQVAQERAKREAEYAKKLKLQQATKKRTLISKYGSGKGEKIADGKIWLGMTKEMAEDSWGKPRAVNRSVGDWGVKEQWVYSDAYLYFDNGILNSWQD